MAAGAGAAAGGRTMAVMVAVAAWEEGVGVPDRDAGESGGGGMSVGLAVVREVDGRLRRPYPQRLS